MTTATAIAKEVINETGKFSIDQIGNEIDRANLIKMISDAPKGGIIHIHAYESKGGYGEVANYFYLKGVNYENMKKNSLEELNEIALDGNYEVKIKRGVWIDSEGKKHTYKAKGRTFKIVNEAYKATDDILIEAIQDLKEQILKPRKKGAKYKKEGNGIYSSENGELYIRDCQLLHKVVLKKGDYPQKATGAKVAIRNAIEKSLPISKYRQALLSGIFDYITIGGQIIMQDETNNRTYVGLAEHKGMVEPRTERIDETVEPLKVATNPLKTTTKQECI